MGIPAEADVGAEVGLWTAGEAEGVAAGAKGERAVAAGVRVASAGDEQAGGHSTAGLVAASFLADGEGQLPRMARVVIS